MAQMILPSLMIFVDFFCGVRAQGEVFPAQLLGDGHEVVPLTIADQRGFNFGENAQSTQGTSLEFLQSDIFQWRAIVASQALLIASRGDMGKHTS